MLEAGAVGWREVGEERGVHDADRRAFGGCGDKGREQAGGVSRVNLVASLACGGVQCAVEKAGAAWVVGPDEGAEPCRVERVARVEGAEVDSGPPGDVRGWQAEGRRVGAAQLAPER